MMSFYKKDLDERWTDEYGVPCCGYMQRVKAAAGSQPIMAHAVADGGVGDQWKPPASVGARRISLANRKLGAA